jgi:hypothetical protein
MFPLKNLLFVLICALPLLAMRSPDPVSPTNIVTAPPVDPVLKKTAQRMETAKAFFPQKSMRNTFPSSAKQKRPVGTVASLVGFFSGKKLPHKGASPREAAAPPKAQFEGLAIAMVIFLFAFAFVGSFWLAGGIYALIAWLAGWAFSWAVFCLVAAVAAFASQLFLLIALLLDI